MAASKDPIPNILDVLTQEEAELLERDLGTWYSSKDEKALATNKESSLRKDIVKKLFPTTKEGSGNKCILLDREYMVQATQTVNRKVDVPSYRTLKEAAEEMGIPMDDLVDWEATLKKSVYNGLTDEQRKFFDQCLIIKDGSVTLEIKPAPKSKT